MAIEGLNATSGKQCKLSTSDWQYSNRWASYSIKPTASRKRKLAPSAAAATDGSDRNELNVLELYSGRQARRHRSRASTTARAHTSPELAIGAAPRRCPSRRAALLRLACVTCLPQPWLVQRWAVVLRESYAGRRVAPQGALVMRVVQGGG